MARNIGSGAPSSRSESRTSSFPWRIRMVFLMLVKGEEFDCSVQAAERAGAVRDRSSWKMWRRPSLTEA